MKTLRILIAAALFLTLSGQALLPAFADASPPAKHANLDDKHLAIQGYDPVSYFDNSPKPGSEKITHTLDGSTYRFASESNKKKFQESPEKYIPAYGGWCATAMAKNKKVEIDPTNYKIVNGRLMLFYKSWLGNALTDWNKDEAGNLKAADENWAKLIKQ